MTGKQLRKIERVRKTILRHLDKKKWEWDLRLSILLDQVDSILFGMR